MRIARNGPLLLAALGIIAGLLALPAIAQDAKTKAKGNDPLGLMGFFDDDPCSFSYCISDSKGRVVAVPVITLSLRCYRVEGNVCHCRPGHRATARGCRR